MTKIFYVALLVIMLLPSVLAAAASVRFARQIDRTQQDAERGTLDSVYVLGHSTVALGRVRLNVYPHMWAAVSLLLGVTTWFVATLFLFFVPTR